MFGLMGVARMSGQPGGTFSPLSLFANSEQGVWYDPSDFASMFQDSAGTTPVTAVEQPVGKINDKSGNGNHATQATAAARPVLRQDGGGRYYLEFDGVDDFLETAAVNLTSTSQLSVFCGFASDTSVGIFAPLYGNGLANSAGTAGKFSAYIPANNSTTARFDFGGVTSQIFTSATAASNVVSVLSHLLDSTTAPQQIIRQDGTQTATGTFDVGSQPFANAAIKIADISHMGGGAYYKGKLYGIVVRGALSSAGEIDNAEAYIAGKSGVVL